MLLCCDFCEGFYDDFGCYFEVCCCSFDGVLIELMIDGECVIGVVEE